ncbi:MAG: glucosaminidase domain-containing protein [Bacteroidetes bacterium]|nr:glucosaminidase domain-containing protein [Bacteroidota bacterium]
MKQYILLLFSVLVATSVKAQSFSERATAYVTKYKDWAIAEQQRSGVPAAITLAQGIHETNAGASELATNANNHFGIKCKKEWIGDTYAYTDDAENECFRKYKSALDSYHDHSDYLRKGNRYAPCFALDTRNYKGWAHALKRCGYATNKSYAQILIRLVEDYQLETYTEEALNPKQKNVALVASTASPVAASMMVEQDAPADATADTPTRVQHEYGKLMKKDGLRGFWAHQGDVLLEYAIQFKLRYSKLLDMNGLPDAPLAKDQFIYIERGGSFDRLMAKDPSTPTPEGANTNPPSGTSKADTMEAPAKADSSPSPAPASNTASDNKPAQILNPAQASAASEERDFAAATAKSTTPSSTQPDTTPAAASTEKPFNIANEKAVEEMPAEANTKAAVKTTQTTQVEQASPMAQDKHEEPQDEFSRLKARLDKVVYAPATKEKQAAPAAENPIPPAAVSPEFHIVKSGETAFGIAKKYQISMQQLLDLNKMSFGTEIKVGQKLRVK